MIFDRVRLGTGGMGHWGWDCRHGDGVPDMGMGFQTRSGVPDMGDGVPDKGLGS